MGIFNSISNKLLALVTILILLSVFTVNATEWFLIDSFESHQWHETNWSGDTATISYDSSWKTQGSTSLKMTTSYVDTGWFAFITNTFQDLTPDHIRFDYNASGSDVYLQVKCLDNTGDENTLDSTTLSLGTGTYTIDNTTNEYDMRQLRFVIGSYSSGQSRTLYIDDLSIDTGGGYFRFDDFEDHPTWDGANDAQNQDWEIYRSEDINHTMYSANNSSTKAMEMTWNDTASTKKYADIVADISGISNTDNIYYLKLDINKPGFTSTEAVYSILIKGTKDSTWDYESVLDFGVYDSNTWITKVVPLYTKKELDTRDEIIIRVTNTDEVESGTIFFDNLYFGETSPSTGIIDLNNLTGKYAGMYTHFLKDWDDSDLDGNDFAGTNGIGWDHDGTIDLTLYNNGYSGKGLSYDYSVNDTDVIRDAWAAYYHVLDYDTDKKYFAIMMKGDSAGFPERVRIEFHDSTNYLSDYTSGLGYVLLNGLSSTSWKQWIIDLENDLIVPSEFDLKDLREVIISVNNVECGEATGAKTGKFYVDEMAFIDSTNRKAFFPGIYLPADPTHDIRTEGVRYMLDDFDGRVLHHGDRVWDKFHNDGEGKWVYDGDVTDLGFTEFFGYTGTGGGDIVGTKDPSFSFGISDKSKTGDAYSFPYSYKIGYNFLPGALHSYIYYYSLLSCYDLEREKLMPSKDLSFADKFSIRLKSGGEGKNPGQVRVEFHDDRWGVVQPDGTKNYTGVGLAYAQLKNIPDEGWTQYWIDIDGTDDVKVIDKDFHWDKLTEVVISYDYKRIEDKEGQIFVDDMFFVDTDLSFDSDADFDVTVDTENNYSKILDLVEKRTFQYFLDTYDESTCLFLDRVHFRDQATVAGVGFGFTTLVIGDERDWIETTKAQDIIETAMDTLLDPDLMASSLQDMLDNTYDHAGYRGFYFHFLEASDGTRKLPHDDGDNTPDAVELSVIDTALLMAGVMTAKEYYSEAGHYNADIVSKANQLLDAVEWDWYLDKESTIWDQDAEEYVVNPHYNQFFMGWKPENAVNGDDKTGFGEQRVNRKYWGHWDTYTDETLLIAITAVASGDVSTDVLYSFNRVEDSEYGTYMSWNGSLFHYFFANLWIDFYGTYGTYSAKDPGNLYDESGANWWKSSVKGGIANRDYCIEGVDGMGRTNVSTFHENSWGLTSCEAVPAGLNNQYIGENGGRPCCMTDIYGFNDGLNFQMDGTVPPYGGISMIGFALNNGFNPDHIKGLMKNYYKNTQLWGGWYGFRDSYTDDDVIKVDKFWDKWEGAYYDVTADSKYPMYKATYFNIDQAPIIIMIENFRTGLIREYFMKNQDINTAMGKIFTGNLNFSNVKVVYTLTDDNKWNLPLNVFLQDKDFSCKGYITAKEFVIEDGRDVTFTANNDDSGTDYISLGSGFNVEVGATFKASFGN